MGLRKTAAEFEPQGPSMLALLVDNISKMTPSEQKVLWIQLNKKKLTQLAHEIDASTIPHNLSGDDIDTLISEAKKYARKKKKG